MTSLNGLTPVNLVNLAGMDVDQVRVREWDRTDRTVAHLDCTEVGITETSLYDIYVRIMRFQSIVHFENILLISMRVS